MRPYIVLPLAFLKFWFYDAPAEIIGFFRSLNAMFNQAFAFTLFLKTLFKPLKGEYREGLVGFSIAMGILIKSGFIIFDFLILICMLIIELAIILAFIAFPVATITLLFL
jgi:hypothetical protein